MATTDQGPAGPAPRIAVGAPGALPIREERLARDGKRRRPSARHDSNLLREGLRLERVPDPHVVVLFGATGDLSHRKVFPALAQLWRTNLLPADWALLAVGRRPYDDEYVPRGRRRRRSTRTAGSSSSRRWSASSSSGSRTTAATSATTRRSTRWPERLEDDAPRARDRAPTCCSTSRPSRRRSRRSSASSGAAGSTTRSTTAAGAGSSSRSRSGATSTRRSG